MTCGSSRCQAVREYSLIRPPRTVFRWDPFAVEVGNGEVVTVVFAVGDALGDALVRPGRVVVHLVFGQYGAQVAPHRESARGRGPLGAGYRRAARRSRWTTSSTTPHPDDRYRRVRVTHQFHPLRPVRTSSSSRTARTGVRTGSISTMRTACCSPCQLGGLM